MGNLDSEVKIIETERLYLREFVYDDAVHLYTMNADPDVLQYAGDEEFVSVEDARNFLKQYKQFKIFKMSRWAVCLKSTDGFLGWCGLKFHPLENYVEVGYRFYKKHWGNGYATESAKASIQYGFETLKLKLIFAHAHVEHSASQRVIEKCGLTFVEQGNYDGMLAKLYKIENPLIEMKRISAEETYAVRHPVLRAGRPFEDCAFKDDELETTVHLGLFFKSELVGVATFLKNNNALFPEEHQYQLRGMAVLKFYQGYKFGTLLLNYGEQLLIRKKVKRIWFNARESAVRFYERHSYEIIGNAFYIPNVGGHYVMSKNVSPNFKKPNFK